MQLNAVVWIYFGNINLLRSHKMPKILIPLILTSSILVPAALERSKHNLNHSPTPSPPPLTKTVNFVIL